jgi:hypothetical protein
MTDGAFATLTSVLVAAFVCYRIAFYISKDAAEATEDKTSKILDDTLVSLERPHKQIEENNRILEQIAQSIESSNQQLFKAFSKAPNHEPTQSRSQSQEQQSQKPPS